MNTVVAPESLANLIMVEKPYNRLYDYELNTDGSINAKVTNEYLSKHEAGPIGVAEAGRHLAILGSIALAKTSNFGEKYYYLTTRANLKRAHKIVYDTPFFNLTVKPVEAQKKLGIVSGELSDANGEPIYAIEVQYQVIPPDTFSKLFSKQYLENPYSNVISTYDQRRELTNLVFDERFVSAHYGAVANEDCKGHFTNYPALPVAIVGNLFVELGITLFTENSEDTFEKVLVKEATINAYRLAFHGENLHFEAKLIKKVSEECMHIICEAKVEEEIIADAVLHFRGVPCFSRN